jgi:hypothetical protein
MNPLSVILSILLLSFAPLLGVDHKSLTYYAIYDYFSNENKRDVNLGKVLINDILSDEDENQFNIVIVNDQEKYVNAYLRGDVTLLGMHVAAFAKNDNELNSVTKKYLVISTNKEPFEEYVTIIRSDMKSIKDIRKAMIEDSLNAQIYSNMFCLNNFKKECKDLFAYTRAKNSESAIINLYMKQTDMINIPLRVWKTAIKLNPALTNHMRIIDTSPKVFTFGLAIIRNNMDENEAKRIDKVKEKLTNKSQLHNQFGTLTKVESISYVSRSEMQEVLAYYNRYLRLLKK